MSARRVVFAFMVTFACALIVFTLPRFVFNTLSGATPQAAAQDTAQAQVVAPATTVTPAPRSLGSRLTGIFGLILILGIGFALSRNRRAISRRVVAWGVGLQLLFAIFVLRVPVGQTIFSWLGATVKKIMGASGAESLNVAASIFMGQTEAPLTIRPFLPRMTLSELMTVMTAGMAHVSGSIMAAYIAFGIEARHLLTAVIMTAPGTIMMSKLFEPETEVPETYGTVRIDMPKQDVNVLDA